MATTTATGLTTSLTTALIVVLAATGAICTRTASAQRLHVRVAGDGCPSAPMLLAQLTPLVAGVAGLHVSSEGPEASSGRTGWPHKPCWDVVVGSAGPTYRVRVGAVDRTIEDGTVNCVERARVASVLIALNYDPPQAAAAAPTAQQPGPLAAPGVAWALQADVDVAYAPAVGAVAYGAGLTGLLRVSSWRFGLGVLAHLPTRWPVGMASRGREVELSAYGLGLRVAQLWRLGPVEIGPAVYGRIVLQQWRGVRVTEPKTTRLLNVALVPGVRAELPLFGAAWAVVASLGVRLELRAPEIVVEPQGAVARAGRGWLGGAVGLQWTMP